jgi:hypothetical protein
VSVVPTQHKPPWTRGHETPHRLPLIAGVSQGFCDYDFPCAVGLVVVVGAVGGGDEGDVKVDVVIL